MAKDIKFNIKLLVDGKEQLVTATTSVAELRKNLEAAKPAADQFREKLISLNQAVETLRNMSSAVNSLRDTMAGLTATYNAVQTSNTMLTTVMKQRINATDEDIKKVKEVISAQTELGVLGGTVQRMGAQQIATFLKEKGTLETLIPAMNDLVAQQKGISATGEDARGVANLMGKAMMGQTSALRRVGITFTAAQEQVMKYGTEQQRAAMLAQIITDNVGHMNAELAKTDAGKLKQLENGFGSVKAKIGEMVSAWMPWIAATAQALSVVNSVIALTQSIKGAMAVMKNFSLTTMTAKSAMAGLTAVTRVLRAAFTGAAIGATTLKVAVKSLLISTGVGVAIWALTEAISYFVSSSDKAKSSTEELTAAEEAAKAAREQEAKQRSEIAAAVDINIAKLKEFKGNKEEENKLVKEMNDTYGATLGYYSSVSQWYTALTGNSKVYCDQLINEIRIQSLAQKAAELADKRHNLLYDENGKARRYSKKRDVRFVKKSNGNGHYAASGQYDVEEIAGSSDLDKASAAVADTIRQEKALKKQMTDLVRESNNIKYKQYEGYSKTAPTTPAKTSTTTHGKNDEPKTYVEQLRAQLSAAQKEMENSLTIEARVQADAKVKDIQAQIDEATKGRVSIGAETEPTYITKGSTADKRQSYSNAQSKASRIQQDYEIGLIGKDEAEKQINELNKQVSALGLKPVKIHFKTSAEELQDKLSEAQREFSNAVTVEAKVDAAVKVARIQAQIDNATNGKVTIAADVEPTYITEGSDADKRQSYNNAQSKAKRIQQDYEIGLIGKDEAEKQIEELNQQITSLGLKPVKLEIDDKGFDKTLGNIESGWGSIQGVGSGLENITDALEENGNAWEQLSAIINGFLSIAKSIQGIVTLINTLTASTKAHTIAATSDAVATTADAAASGANTAAKSGEAVADATASGAKLPFPANIAAIAAGVAAVVAALAMVSGFATGGVIGGASTSGDKKFARVNSGEMILNKTQQARLFGLIEGKFQPTTFTDRRMQPIVMPDISKNIEPTVTEVSINMNANARRIVELTSETRRVAAKSGKRYDA